MSFQLIPLVGSQPAIELSTTQFVIPAGAGATFAASNNVATVTFNAAHGLTMNPAANVLPNYYITFGGSTSALSGTGILVGNYFRILSIPSATAITIYTTITAATVTSMTGIPVFFPSFAVGPTITGASPTQTISSVVTPMPLPVLAGCQVNATLGANLVANYAPTPATGYGLIPLDATTTTLLGGTPATAPTVRVLSAASTNAQIEMAYPWGFFNASGTTATSYISVLR